MNKILIIIVLILIIISLSNNNIPNLFKKNKELLQGALSGALVTIILHKPLIENLATGVGENSCSEVEPTVCENGDFDSTFSYNNEPEIECCRTAPEETAPQEEEPAVIGAPQISLGVETEPSNNGSCIAWLENNQCSNDVEPEPDSSDMYEPDSGEPEDVCCRESWGTFDAVVIVLVCVLCVIGFTIQHKPDVAFGVISGTHAFGILSVLVPIAYILYCMHLMYQDKSRSEFSGWSSVGLVAIFLAFGLYKKFGYEKEFGKKGRRSGSLKTPLLSGFSEQPGDSSQNLTKKKGVKKTLWNLNDNRARPPSHNLAKKKGAKKSWWNLNDNRGSRPRPESIAIELTDFK